MGPDDTTGWPCPYCRAAVPDEADRCAACGAQLRESGSDLFSDAVRYESPEAPPLLRQVESVVVTDSVPIEASVIPPTPPVVVPVAPAVAVAGPVDDRNGLADAVGRLAPGAAERATVPICVAGALLDDDEQVRGVVTGEMLGHPAAIVLTDRRVVVVNGRRWQPIVDTFVLGPGLVVRGRHDRRVALLTFSEGQRLSTVDGITDVALAVELTEQMRDS